MTEYDAKLNLPIAFSPQALPFQDIRNTLPQLLSCHHIGQFHTAETEKYAHVTYFLNGGNEAVLPGEDRSMIQSLKVATYDLAPEMQTPKVTDVACEAISSGKYPFVVLNLANPDMVGHTGILEAGILAVESVDRAFAKLLETIQEAKGTLVITADHGNCEEMINLQTGEPHTAHTTNPVPAVVANFQEEDLLNLSKGTKLVDGTLADIAPTILEIMGIEKPIEMTGKSLLKR
jgi:2,3-bisphosphoglycerate-independent phosphoglycerate mutase